MPCYRIALIGRARKGIANPRAALSAAMMCRRLGSQHKDPLAAAAAHRIEAAVGKALQDPKARTPDIGGAATTRAAGDAVIKACQAEEIEWTSRSFVT